MSTVRTSAWIAALTMLWTSFDLLAQVYCQSYSVAIVDTCSSIIELDRRPTVALSSGTQLLLHRSQGLAEDGVNAAGVMMLCSLDTINGQRIYLRDDIRQLCAPNAKIQLIIPLRTDDLQEHSEVRCMPWNGRHGGIIALVDRAIDLRNKRVNADGCGFRGGYHVFSTADTVSNDQRTWQIRSESYTTQLDASSGRSGRPRNAGGAGGSMSGFGGNGGGTSTAFQPTQPGGSSTDAMLHQHTVFGAGGGAGHRNDLNTSAGGRGGGLIIIVADSIIADTATFMSVAGSPGASARYDGAGGGGAGGTVVLSGPGRLSGGTIDLRGGNGGSVVAGLFGSGPGGGGAGGILVSSGAQPLSNIQGDGGTAGSVIASNNHTGTYGAENGNNAIIHDRKEVFLPRSMRRATPLRLQARDTVVPYGSTTTIVAQAEGVITWNNPDIVRLIRDGTLVETPVITQARWFSCSVITPSGCMQHDSIRIRPELDAVSLVVEADYARAKPGDTIDVFIRMSLSAPLDRQVQGVAIVSSYAGVAQALRGRHVAEHRTSSSIPFTIAPGSTSTFRREKFAIVLGDSAATQLRIDSVSLDRPTLQVRRRHGRISLDDLCVTGGRMRLFNPHSPKFTIEDRRITAHAEQVWIVDILGRDVPCVITRQSDVTIVQLPQHARGAMFLRMRQHDVVATVPIWLE